MIKNDHIKSAIITVLTALMYIPTFVWMYDRWTSAETYYSHGFLIPLISAFLVWHKRKDLSVIPVAPAALPGWGLFLSGIAIHLISSLWQVYFSSGFSMILVVSGLVMIFLGKGFFRAVAFQVLFLVFMIPLPLVAISNISFRLKILASQAAVFFVNLLGLPAIREGSVIKTANSYLIVEDPCSGIRSLIALIALGCLMAYLSKASRKGKILLFLSSVPIALFANVARIIVLTFVSEIYGARIATGLFHDIMGYVVFIIAFTGLKIVSRAVK